VNITTISSCAAPIEKPARCGGDASCENARELDAEPSPLADQVDALEDRRFGLTMEALADVDAGRTVDHAQVEAWIASLDTAMPLPVPACR
jgi:predicted transcriptional regulator